MYYAEDVIEEVRSRNDIVSVISEYVKLQRKGSSYFGLCRLKCTGCGHQIMVARKLVEKNTRGLRKKDA